MKDSRDRTAVVLDPHPLWHEAIEKVLNGVGVRVVAKTTWAEAGLAAVQEHRPDLFVTEATIPDGSLDGPGCVRLARNSVPSLRTIVVSDRSDAESIQTAFAAGATVYVVKTTPPKDLEAAVRQAFVQSVYLAPAGLKASAAVPAPTPVADAVHGLTRRELEILRLVADGHSNAELARMLWLTEQTVKFHLSNVYRKLGVSNRTEASRWAQVRGLLPEPALQVSA